MSVETPFYELNPDSLMEAAEEAGFEPTGEFSQLNSYENRVFDIALEDRTRVVAKFYRPGRWDRATILEEHEFLADLKANDIPAVAPLKLRGGSTLITHQGLLTAFFPKIRGRLPDELLPHELVDVGRLLARVHQVGAQKTCDHRPVMDVGGAGGWPTLDFLQEWIAPEIRHRYNEAAETLLQLAEDELNPEEYQRIHGDCHRGNLLNTGSATAVGSERFFLVDFDDFVHGPVVQDFWMLLSGDPDTADEEKELFLQGYEELRHFPHHQWGWIPMLRGMRILMYSGWIAHRWKDPSFPKIFPDFGSYSYWAREVESLEKVVAAARGL